MSSIANMRSLASAFCLLVGLTLSLPPVDAQTNNVDREVDYDVCYESLDRFGGTDRQMDVDEYLDFVKDFGGRTECLGPLGELPLRLRLGFNQLACECLVRGGPDDCCEGDNAHVPTTGTLDSDTTNLEEQTFLRQTCLRTDQLVIAFCGPPPPVTAPPPPQFNPVTPRAIDSGLSDGDRTAIIIGSILAAILLCLLLCCCRRRRWCLFAGKKYESDESSSSSSSSEDDTIEGGHERTEEEIIPPITQRIEEEIERPEALAAVPAAIEDVQEEVLHPDANRTRNIMEEEVDEDDQALGSWNRTIEDPEYEDIEDPRRLGGYEQLEPPEVPQEDMKLRHVERPSLPPPEDDPHEIEHYVPDGGVVEYERDWQGGYEADGGYQPEEVAQKQPVEPYRYKYDPEIKEEPEPVDNRKYRKIEGLGQGEVWNQLEGGDDNDSQPKGQQTDMFDWVIRETLNTLDERGDDLKGSRHSKNSKGSKDSKDSRSRRS